MAAIAAAVLLAGTWSGTQLVVPVSGQQQIEVMPGPMIEDPPGQFTGVSSFVRGEDIIAPSAALSTFVVTYNGFSPEAQTAFQSAVDVWASQLVSSVPIRVTANWVPLGPGVLGSAGPNWIFRNFAGAPLANAWYGAALAKKLNGTDLTAGLGDPADIIANFSSTFSWYYGLDGNAGGLFDLKTVALHELGHALGFFGSMTVSGGVGSWGFNISPLNPAAYDLFAINGSSQFLTNTTLFPNSSAALGSQLTSNNVFFAGVKAAAGNSGVVPKLYAPASWAQGSSFSHFDEATYPQGNANSLMTPFLSPGEAIHSLGATLSGLFTDIGWTLAGKARGDVDGDLKSDITVYRPSAGIWYSLLSGTNFTSSMANGWGVNTDVPAPADFDGDGKSDRAVYRPSAGSWYVLRSSSNFTTSSSYTFGIATDVPVPADFDGDGKADVAVYRPSTGTWFILRSTTNYTSHVAYTWGVSTDTPLAADFDGDGKADLGIYRAGTWYVLRSNSSFTAYSAYSWGIASDLPVPADYDGDGRTDPAVFRPSAGVWYILLSTSNHTSYIGRAWGLSTDVPVPGDYNGDNKADIAIFRAGVWYILLSNTNWTTYVAYVWGVGSDVPMNMKP